ncbi:hypothetical protein DSW25_14990 [Sulfitobacter donghicola DSW-25 = KCTC 12864 = JCM 14565]|uniref:DUF6456 domain-containing protein n=2 Tax=Sulfitobacter TaxID=60136 RepID=A0A073ISM6_9RHOB|nr:DUF6456 domain-containing protein [Sulfitobacter donghicola]KEJ88402.1 hypothetical protein DSW25_14990 [Sulfitobacter donghicola DSW-25 = KCTC 12864 = JCM 14565]
MGKLSPQLPGWVPQSVQNYIDHTEMGVPIRAIARQQGCHASTILRQIRRVETLRDDPLVDGVIKTLGGSAEGEGETKNGQLVKMAPDTTQPVIAEADQLKADSLRVLRRMCETGAVLAVAADMEKGVIVRDGQDGQNTRTGVVDRTTAEAMALKGWIVASSNGRITRYQITASGRAALADMMARDENAKAVGGFEQEADTQRSAPRRIRYGLAESPLAALARRRDREGELFLSDDLVSAGERLREDFELAQMEAEVAQNWEGFLEEIRTGSVSASSEQSNRGKQAHDRVVAALKDLGAGLSDVTLRCCCFLEGLETAEKTLGWSARSGKIVLRIALMRLKQHYLEEVDPQSAMIG